MTVQPEPISTQPLSSGRWDASGSWEQATWEAKEQAFKWASGLPLKELNKVVLLMYRDIGAYTLYEREAVLLVVSLILGKVGDFMERMEQ